jgi:hypothetical protein
MYQRMANIIAKNDTKLLPKELSYYHMRNTGLTINRGDATENTHQISNVPLSYLMGGILIIMEVETMTVLEGAGAENLLKTINIVSHPSSTQMTSFYYADILSNQPGLPMGEFCKQHLAFIKPNKGTNLANNNMVGKNARNQGAQFISIQYGPDDEKSGDAKEMDLFFNLLAGSPSNTKQQMAGTAGRGCAFMLKDIGLRYTPTVIEKPTMIDASVDYGVRRMEQPAVIDPLTKKAINIIPDTRF